MRIVLPPPDQTVVIQGVSWAKFESILDDLEEHPARRIAYDHGKLEIMSPSNIHERITRIFELLLYILSDEFGLETVSTGAVTLCRADLERAVEGDNTFYITNEKRLRKVKNLDLHCHPPPDLAIEVDITTKSLARFPIYAALGVSELWRYHRGTLSIHRLSVHRHCGEKYEEAQSSLYFLDFPVSELARFVETFLQGEMGKNQILRLFREWVREQRGC